MSQVLTIVVVLGLAATPLFLAGFVRGLSNAISEYRSGVPEPTDVPDDKLGGTAAISVVASAVIIALAGVAPQFIYIGPFLVIGTAAACGVAFFLEKSAAKG